MIRGLRSGQAQASSVADRRAGRAGALPVVRKSLRARRPCPGAAPVNSRVEDYFFRAYSIVIVFISFLAPGGVEYMSNV